MSSNRTKVEFKINNEVVVIEDRDLTEKEITDMKFIIAEECEVAYFEVTHNVIKEEREVSDEVDITDIGLIFFKDTYPNPIQGIFCALVQGSDEYLDAILDGTLLDSLNFYINDAK